MSARISGVKNFESKAVSLLRGLPLSQVQSQSEKGTIFSTFVGVAVADPPGVCATTASAGAAAGNASTLARVPAAEDVSVAAVRLFSSASCALICSMRTFIAASSFSSASATPRSGGPRIGRVEALCCPWHLRQILQATVRAGLPFWSVNRVAPESARNSAEPDQQRDSRQALLGKLKSLPPYAIELL